MVCFSPSTSRSITAGLGRHTVSLNQQLLNQHQILLVQPTINVHPVFAFTIYSARPMLSFCGVVPHYLDFHRSHLQKSIHRFCAANINFSFNWTRPCFVLALQNHQNRLEWSKVVPDCYDL